MNEDGESVRENGFRGLSGIDGSNRRGLPLILSERIKRGDGESLIAEILGSDAAYLGGCDFLNRL